MPKEKTKSKDKNKYLVNKGIYIFSLIISIILMIPNCIWNRTLFSTLSGIGCSGFAAAIMAIFLEISSNKKEILRKNRARQSYFSAIYDHLKILLGRLLWFDERLEDENFNWNLDLKEYSSVKYMLFAHGRYNETVISGDEAEKKLNELSKKYDLEQQKNMKKETLAKVQRMFDILYVSDPYLISELKKLDENKLILNAEDYMDLEDIKRLVSNMQLALTLMGKKDKNYGVSIKLLLDVFKRICLIGDYSTDINIGFQQFFISPNEL